MKAEFWLSVLFLVVIALLYLWDAYWLAMGLNERSASRVLHDWSKDSPILPFVVGVLIGHLFW